MARNVSVTRSAKENSMAVIRRFTKKMNQSGVLQRAKNIRFHKRSASPFTEKKQALRSISKREQFDELAKQGKLPPSRRRR